MESYGRSMLQDRSTVKKLRFALDQHASPVPRITRGILFPRLAPGDDEKRFEKFLRAIRKLNNVSDARRFRSEISSQLKKEAAQVKDPVHLRRLEIGKRLLDQRVDHLAVGRKRSYDIHETPKNATSRLENSSLVDILHDTSGLTYFMEYMDRQKLLTLVQFWIVVDGFRTPLESDFADDDINTASLSYTELDRKDLAQIYDCYFSKLELKISDTSRRIVREFLKAGKDASPRQYYLARKEILKAQTATLDVMQEKVSNRISSKNEQLQLHVNSSLDLTNSIAKPNYNWYTRSKTNGNSPIITDDDYIETEGMGDSIGSLDQVSNRDLPDNKVVQAMEAALNMIMEDKPNVEDLRNSLFDEEGCPSPFRQSQNTSSPSSSVHRKRANKFAEKFERIEKPNISSLGLVNMSSRIGVFKDDDLFPDEEKFMSDEHEDPEEDESDKDDEVHEAAPGDLGLAEAIMALTIDIERLEAQDDVIDSMTRKAELTNNTAELRILKKSKTSLQREIRRKELQRRQYVVQESDNSLFGRSNIKIKSVQVGREDDGREFAVYVIEINRKAGEQIPAATWTIARRYSEFLELHQRLREKYTSIRNSNFPRRRMVMKLQTEFLQKRRQALEKYLREILLLPEVCRSIELRSFLSESVTSPGGDSFHDNDENKKDLVTRLYNSITDGMEEIFGSIPVFDQISVAGQNLISSATQQLISIPSTGIEDPLSAAEAEAELNAFENKELEPFIKPICDIFLEIFELNHGNNWLRGRAVVVVLHQLLGGTIERKVRENIKGLFSEDSIVRYIALLRDSIWPDGELKTEKKPRTSAQKVKSKTEASFMLATLIPDLAASVVGRVNAQAASRRIFATLNNPRLKGN
ncbi:hypothetical protein HI914_05808 [Erysiphe necator]|nr:hypothetical protein HI914_05808 [Erysiphe necator]